MNINNHKCQQLGKQSQMSVKVSPLKNFEKRRFEHILTVQRLEVLHCSFNQKIGWLVVIWHGAGRFLTGQLAQRPSGWPSTRTYFVQLMELPARMPSMDGASVIMVLELQERVATVRLPDDTLEQWSVASLPEGALEGNRVRLTVTAGDLEVHLLPRNLPLA